MKGTARSLAGKTKYYVVWKGRKRGIFSSWEECQAQVEGFTGAQYKSFTNRAAAQQAFTEGVLPQKGKSGSGREWLFSPHPPLTESIAVDAACSGSPGPLEYRGVNLKSGRQIFREGPYRNGTNNVGEFLAIVQALRLLEKTRRSIPVYSDSKTAITWVKKKHCNTRLVKDRSNAVLFDLIQRAETWLKQNSFTSPVLKWDTQAWGEIPADFDRK